MPDLQCSDAVAVLPACIWWQLVPRKGLKVRLDKAFENQPSHQVFELLQYLGQGNIQKTKAV